MDYTKKKTRPFNAHIINIVEKFGKLRIMKFIYNMVNRVNITYPAEGPVLHIKAHAHNIHIILFIRQASSGVEYTKERVQLYTTETNSSHETVIIIVLKETSLRPGHEYTCCNRSE